MKKFQSLGKQLSKEEQKKIGGGNYLVCSCLSNGNETSDAVGCVGTDTYCQNAAYEYCKNNGYNGTLCYM